ncbi:MAG TPA: hypothetical protein VK149_04215 [Sideroxyarcus sp.]|nr:hypothetical protein [Sideroxyarcus sp.]
MAIKDGIYGYVGGTVGRVFSTKNGPAFVVEVQDEKSQYPTRVTVWGLGDQVAEGDRVKVRGFYSAKKRDYESPSGPKVTIEQAINSPEIVEHEAGAANSFDPTRAGLVEIDETPF